MNDKIVILIGVKDMEKINMIYLISSHKNKIHMTTASYDENKHSIAKKLYSLYLKTIADSITFIPNEKIFTENFRFSFTITSKIGEPVSFNRFLKLFNENYIPKI